MTATAHRLRNRLPILLACGLITAATGTARESAAAPADGAPRGAAASALLFEDVRIFDGTASRLSGPAHVLVVGNTIRTISPTPIEPPAGVPLVRIAGAGRTLMPGLIDVHVHLTFGALSQAQMMSPDMTPQKAEDAAAVQAERMLLRGFTAVRDVGGPVFTLKRRIDAGEVRGPRIWPSGAVVSQTSGHGDFRLPSEPSRRFTGQLSRSEQLGANFIADGRDEVLTAVRENLRQGASQIKLMAGGGTSSIYDPIDVTQYTVDEMRAAVEAAEDWNTYVTVHAYTPRAVRRAIEVGVKCIEHGQLLDEATLKLMAQRGVWLSLQNLVADTPDMDPLRREKRRPVIAGTERVWALAKKHGVKLAWGTDFLFEPELNAEQNDYILRLTKWFTPAEILKMITHDNAQLLALSGPRSPYQGRLGVVAEGALADLILVAGDPLANLELVADPERNFVVIVKDGVVLKDATPTQHPSASVGAEGVNDAGPVLLVGTTWRLVRLGETAVERHANQPEPHLVLRAEDARFAGSDGCNRIMGSFRTQADRLELGSVASTMMACQHGMEQARRYTDALGAARSYRIDGGRLELFDAQGKAVAGFEAGESR